jgi:antitoxin MazE
MYIFLAGVYSMHTVVQKWGNSLGIRIPAVFTRELNLKSGSPVEILDDGGKLVIVPQKQTLEDLLSLVTGDNIHSSIDSGEPMGNEEW